MEKWEYAEIEVKKINQSDGFSGVEIKINSSQFTVGNLDVTGAKYLNPNILNTSDLKVTHLPSNNIDAIWTTTNPDPQTGEEFEFQLINSIPKSSGISIVSNSTETYVAKGGHKVISSTAPYTGISFSKYVSGMYGELKYNTYDWYHFDEYYTIHTNVRVGATLLIRYKTYNDAYEVDSHYDALRYSSTFIMKYIEGFICTLYTGYWETYMSNGIWYRETAKVELYGDSGTLKMRNYRHRESNREVEIVDMRQFMSCVVVN